MLKSSRSSLNLFKMLSRRYRKWVNQQKMMLNLLHLGLSQLIQVEPINKCIKSVSKPPKSIDSNVNRVKTTCTELVSIQKRDWISLNLIEPGRKRLNWPLISWDWTWTGLRLSWTGFARLGWTRVGEPTLNIWTRLAKLWPKSGWEARQFRSNEKWFRSGP